MSDYTKMAGRYDEFMLAGYYPYDEIVEDLAQLDMTSVLEVGVGTGLILEQLASRRPDLEITGIDVTAAMLDIARRRLGVYPEIVLEQQDVVSLQLRATFDVAYSYGGPMYFVSSSRGDSSSDDGYTLISHILDAESNVRAFEHIADHLRPGGRLLLGIQDPHTDYTSTIGKQVVYSQSITPTPDGFSKHYLLTDYGQTVMDHTLDYRTIPRADAMDMLGKCGFDPEDNPGVGMFLGFRKR
jgi:SAM-dependent methyltransferase